jgi:hypothetical protein
MRLRGFHSRAQAALNNDPHLVLRTTLSRLMGEGLIVVLLFLLPAFAHAQSMGGNGISGSSAIAGNSLASHNFANSINSAGTISGAQPASTDLSDLPIPASSGGTGVTSPTAHRITIAEGTSAMTLIALATDNLLQGTTGADPAGVSIPNCGDGTHALAYSTSTHLFSCQALSGSGLSGLTDNGTNMTATEPLGWTADTSGATTQLTGVNTAGWVDPASFGASYSTNSYTGTAVASNQTVTMSANDFVANNGVFIPHGGAACSINSTNCTSITVTAPTVQLGKCDQIQQNSPYAPSNWAADMRVFFTRNGEPFARLGSVTNHIEYTESAGSYGFSSDPYEPITICYAQTTPTAGVHSIAVKEAALDANGGMTAASSAATLSSVATIYPTSTRPVLITGSTVTGATGYAFWESVDGGTYYLARVVWVDKPTVDQGTSTDGAGNSYIEWGEPAATDEQTPATPPGSALNDGLFTTVSSKSGNNLVLAVAPSVSASVTVKHDDAPGRNAAIAYCETLAHLDCRLFAKSAETRLSQLTLPSGSSLKQLMIEGQDSHASYMTFFGNGGGHWCHWVGNPTFVSYGGQFVDSTGVPLTLRDLTIQSTSSAADCLFDGYAGTGWLPFTTYDVNWYGPSGSFQNRGWLWGDGGGAHVGIFNFFLQDVELQNAVNGATFGNGYSANYQTWPGLLLGAGICYASGLANINISQWVHENPWNAFGPCGGTDDATTSGGYIQGLHITNPYASDVEPISNTVTTLAQQTTVVITSSTFSAGVVTAVCTGANCNPFLTGDPIYVKSGGTNNTASYTVEPVTYISSTSFSYPNATGQATCASSCGTAQAVVDVQGTLFTLNGNNLAIEDSAMGSHGTTEGGVWVQGFASGNETVVRNLSINTGAFGLIAEGQVDARDNQFQGWLAITPASR